MDPKERSPADNKRRREEEKMRKREAAAAQRLAEQEEVESLTLGEYSALDDETVEQIATKMGLETKVLMKLIQRLQKLYQRLARRLVKSLEELIMELLERIPSVKMIIQTITKLNESDFDNITEVISNSFNKH